MRPNFPCALLAAAVALAAPGLAQADDTATREAQTRFREGIARVKAGDFEAARRSFAQAYAVIHKPDILWNLALSEQKTGHTLDALAHFRELQRDFPPGADRADAGKHLAELVAATGHLDVTAPPGAQVLIDGTVQGTAPFSAPIDVLPGHHRIEVRVAQGGAKQAEAECGAGQVTRVGFATNDAPPPVAAHPAEPLPGAPPPATEPPGSAASPSDDTFWDARGITVVTVGGLAVVAAGMGLAFGVVSNSDANTASSLSKQNPSCAGVSSSGCDSLASTVKSAHTAYVTSEAMWITAGVLAAGAIGTFFLWPRSTGAATTGVTLVPAVGPGSAGAVAVGRF